MLPPCIDQPKERRAGPRRICQRHCLVRFDRRRLDGRPGSVGAEGSIGDLSASGVSLLMRPAVPALAEDLGWIDGAWLNRQALAGPRLNVASICWNRSNSPSASG